MFDGRITGELAQTEADERKVGLLMAGDHGQGGGLMARGRELPGWAEYGLLPLLNLLLAFLVSGLVVLLLGENPLEAAQLLVYGAFGYGEAIGYTLYYATNFIFTGLAVAVAYHAGLFNIGGEGQAYIGGLGAHARRRSPPATCRHPSRCRSPSWPRPLFGAVWGFIPGWLQAKRGSHVVITTIMLNFVAASIMTYLLVNVLIVPGSRSPESAGYPPSVWMPSLSAPLAAFGVDLGQAPLNALAAAGARLLRPGLALRLEEPARLRAAGGRPQRGGGGLRRHLARPADHPRHDDLGRARRPHGDQRADGRPAPADAQLHGRLRLRRHRRGADGPQPPARHRAGRASCSARSTRAARSSTFDMPAINRDMVVVIQGLVILFAGALENMFRAALAAHLRWRAPRLEAAV